jgi:hypothetical protein
VEARAKRKTERSAAWTRTRHRFSNAFMQDLAAVWGRAWRETMIATAKVNPEGFFATRAWLLPREVAISIQTQTPTLDAAESIAVNIAKLPDRLSKPEDK